MNHKVSVCIVTDEVFPFTQGGIGRVVHNILRDAQARGAPVEFHLMVPAYVGLEPQAVERYFDEGLRVHVVAFREQGELAAEPYGLVPPPEAYADSRWHAESVDILGAFRRLAEDGVFFDVIEFPDFRGWAFAILQEKRLGLGFRDTEIAVRLHSSYGIIQSYDPHTLEVENLGRYELERKALLDADRIIAHLPAIAEYNRSFYGFDQAWMDRVSVAFPPVVFPIPDVGRPPLSTGRSPKDLVFVTKIQGFKRPDLFVRAAATVMRQVPVFCGDAVLSCHSFWPEFEQEIRELIPVDLRHRFKFRKPGPDREHLMRNSVVVIPSDYESLNLTAYEVATAGGWLVLNGKALAFGEGTPFVDGENCYKSVDDSVEACAEAMVRALQGPPLRMERLPVVPQVWEASSDVPRVALPPVKPASRAPLSVVVYNHNQGQFLSEGLARIVDSSHANVEVIVVDDASTNAFDLQIIEALASGASREDAGLKLIRNPVRRGEAASRNIALAVSSGKYLAFLRAADRIEAGFLALAVDALEDSSDYAGVVPTSGYFTDDDALMERRFTGYGTFLGDAPSDLLLGNRAGPPGTVWRRSIVDATRFDETVDPLCDWDFNARAILAGARLLVTNHIALHERRPSGRPALSARREAELAIRILDHLPRPLPVRARLSFTWAGVPRRARKASTEPPAPEESSAPEDAVALLRPLRYSLLDRLNADLKRLPQVHAALKAVVQVGTRPLTAGVRRAAGVDPGLVERPLRDDLADTANVLVKALTGPLHPGLKRLLSRDK